MAHGHGGMADWKDAKVYRTSMHMATAEWLIGGTLRCIILLCTWPWRNGWLEEH